MKLLNNSNLEALSSQIVFFTQIYRKTAFLLSFLCDIGSGSVKPDCMATDLLR